MVLVIHFYSFKDFCLVPKAKEHPNYVSAALGLTYRIKTKNFLIEPFVKYTKNFSDIANGTMHFSNIPNRPYTTIDGTFKQAGNQLSFGFNMYIKKWKKK